MTFESEAISHAPHTGSSGGWTPNDYPQKTAKGKPRLLMIHHAVKILHVSHPAPYTSILNLL